MQVLRTIVNRVHGLVQNHRLIRFVIAGGTAALIHLSTFLICTEVFDIWYIYATSIGFIGGVTTSFLLQKYWTFADTSTHLIAAQSAGYLSLALGNLYLNGQIMYVLVEFQDLLPFFAQVVASACISLESFFISSYIFKKRTQ